MMSWRLDASVVLSAQLFAEQLAGMYYGSVDLFLSD
jgi:hypothetical protein